MLTLTVSSDETTVTALENLEKHLEHGTLSVRLDAVSTVLDAIRAAAVAVTPTEAAILEADPTRMAMLAQTIMAVSTAAKALADAAAKADPQDPNAAAIHGALGQLHL